MQPIIQSSCRQTRCAAATDEPLSKGDRAFDAAGLGRGLALFEVSLLLCLRRVDAAAAVARRTALLHRCRRHRRRRRRRLQCHPAGRTARVALGARGARGGGLRGGGMREIVTRARAHQRSVHPRCVHRRWWHVTHARMRRQAGGRRWKQHLLRRRRRSEVGFEIVVVVVVVIVVVVIVIVCLRAHVVIGIWVLKRPRADGIPAVRFVECHEHLMRDVIDTRTHTLAL
mmetsp:Transcript_36045/g.94901  ORF Transcript_36045/g.94901 Transcript_36045/m.94901 type:complete len:228 (-) Transcript_36045:1169-1852(-)